MPVRILIILFLTLHFFQLAAQYNPVKSSKPVTSFNFEMLTGGIIILQAKVDNLNDTLHFVLDTGSGGISLDSATAEKLNIKSQISNKIVRGIAGAKYVAFAYNHTLQLPGLTVDSLDFHINDYELLSSVYGMKIDGIIGYSFLKNYVLHVNYDKRLITVYPPHNVLYPKKGHLLKPKITQIPIQELTINDTRNIKANYYFDSGAGLCLLLSDAFVNDSSAIKKNKKLYTTQAEGLGGKKPMLLTYVNKVMLGPYKFTKVPAYILHDEYKVTNYPSNAGLIGNDILRRFNTIINYPAGEIHLQPNGYLREPFDYSYTGLGIYLYNNEVTIEDIVPKSPGDKAGFKTGDVILGVDNNFSGSIRAYKDLLMQSGKTLPVLIIRNGETLIINLKVGNILHK